MRIERPADIEGWTKPAIPDGPPEPGYEAWLAGEIADGLAELDAGEGVPAEEVWRAFGLE